MNSGIFKLDWVNVKSAIAYGLVTMVLVFILSVVEGVIKHGSIFGVDWKIIIDSGVIASFSVLSVVVSIVKNLFTTDKGNFLGVATVIPDKN